MPNLTQKPCPHGYRINKTGSDIITNGLRSHSMSGQWCCAMGQRCAARDCQMVLFQSHCVE